MELSRRNGASAEQALRAMAISIQEQQIRIDGLVNTISSLCARLNLLEEYVAQQRISAIGHGPTV